jgi:hypothetical protein
MGDKNPKNRAKGEKQKANDKAADQKKAQASKDAKSATNPNKPKK